MARRTASGGAVFCALWALGSFHCAHATEVYSEESVKAAFIHRFAGYVEWANEGASTQNFTIAVLGGNEIAIRLQALTADRLVHNRPVVVRRVSGVHEAGDAQMLYIGPKHRSDLKVLVQAVGRRNILVISDEADGLESGSTINFLKVDRRIRFEVSLEAARRTGLEISSELLSVAARVQGGRPRSATASATGGDVE